MMNNMISLTPETMGHSALLIVDFQTAFKDSIAAFSTTAKRVSFCVEAAKLLNIPMICTEQNPVKLGHTEPGILSLLPVNTPVFPKMSFSAMGAPELMQWLLSNKIKRLYIVGLEMAICVFQTVCEVRDHFIEPVIIRDAICGRREEDSACIINYLSQAGIPFLPSETVFYALVQTAAVKDFKPFLEIVKKYS